MKNERGFKMICRKEQFHSMYTQYKLRKLFLDYTNRAIYKSWNNWCFKVSGNAIYYFEKGYDEDYVKRSAIND